MNTLRSQDPIFWVPGLGGGRDGTRLLQRGGCGQNEGGKKGLGFNGFTLLSMGLSLGCPQKHGFTN